jgi:hypothetical protein
MNHFRTGSGRLKLPAMPGDVPKRTARGDPHSTTGQTVWGGRPDADVTTSATHFILPAGCWRYLYLVPQKFATDPTPGCERGDDNIMVTSTHGLSNRLITADGWGALDRSVSAMGEPERLVRAGLPRRREPLPTRARWAMTLDRYLGNGKPTIRSESLGCPVAPSPRQPAATMRARRAANPATWAGSVRVHADGGSEPRRCGPPRRGESAMRASLVTEAWPFRREPVLLIAQRSCRRTGSASWAAARPQGDHLGEFFAARGMGFSRQPRMRMIRADPELATSDPEDGTGSLAGVVTDSDTAPVSEGRVLPTQPDHGRLPAVRPGRPSGIARR